MPNYRKKPVVIEAEQFNGIEYPSDFMRKGICWVGHHYGDNPATHFESPHIHTLEGIMRVSAGDYVIKGINGEYYPCKPDIFAKSYEEVK